MNAVFQVSTARPISSSQKCLSYVARASSSSSLASGPSDKLGGSGGKNHESVGVADLACFMGGAVCGNGWIPSAVFIVMQRTTQAGDGLVNQFCGTRLTVQESEGIHVRHAAGDPRVDVLGQIRIAGIVQPVGATLRGGEIVSEMQELVGFRLEQGMVFFGAEHVGFGREVQVIDQVLP